MKDRSLDEFANSKAESAEESAEGVEPAEATARSVPDGVSCPACGDTVRRLWTGREELVCRACKEW